MTPVKKPIEQLVKEYFDQYGAIIVGMHQDIQSQQDVVDLKLKTMQSQFDKIARKFQEGIGQRSGDLLAATELLAESLEGEDDRHQLRIGELDSTSNQIKKDFINIRKTARSQNHELMDSLTKCAESAVSTVSNATRAATEKIGEQLDNLYRNLTSQRAAFSKKISEFEAIRRDIDIKIKLLSEKTEEHFEREARLNAEHNEREAAYNAKIRQLFIATTTIAALLGICGVMYGIFK